ncbi:hypothetical protein ACJX0J_040003, partial [Zea mays]
FHHLEIQTEHIVMIERLIHLEIQTEHIIKPLLTLRYWHGAYREKEASAALGILAIRLNCYWASLWLPIPLDKLYNNFWFYAEPIAIQDDYKAYNFVPLPFEFKEQASFRTPSLEWMKLLGTILIKLLRSKGSEIMTQSLPFSTLGSSGIESLKFFEETAEAANDLSEEAASKLKEQAEALGKK